jgi:hypothetical protein
MPVEILTASQRTEWERFPEEIDEASLTAFFSYPVPQAGGRRLRGGACAAARDRELDGTGLLSLRRSPRRRGLTGRHPGQKPPEVALGDRSPLPG